MSGDSGVTPAHGEAEGGAQGGQPIGESRRQHPRDLRLGRRDRRRLRAQAEPVGGDQAQDHGHGLVVGEHQRRQLEAGREPVTAVPAAFRGDRDAQVGQGAGIATDGPLVDRETLGQVADGHPAVRLQQLQHGEDTSSGMGHIFVYTGRNLPGIRS